MVPLSEKLRPTLLTEVVGQSHITKKNSFFQKAIETKKPISLLLVGPPGSGKTTLARLYLKSFSFYNFSLSAVFSGVADIKKIIKKANESPLLNKPTILFIDEIHRFNKTQQDAFLPFIEDGTIILVGATTENPSFSLNNALLSRLHILTLNHLEKDDLKEIINRYIEKTKISWLKKEEQNYLIDLSDGDARYLINMLEVIEKYEKPLNVKALEKILQKKLPLYDRASDNHFNLISALHKSIRGSDVDASLFWLLRMLEAKEDPMYILRRLIRIAIEDISFTDPDILNKLLAYKDAFLFLGSPEGDLAIASAVICLALSPKSNSAYLAYKKAKEAANRFSNLSPPIHILNATSKYSKDLGCSKDYIYDHDTKDSFSAQNYFPKNMERISFYSPKDIGFERELQKRLEYFKKLRQKIAKN